MTRRLLGLAALAALPVLALVAFFVVPVAAMVSLGLEGDGGLGGALEVLTRERTHRVLLFTLGTAAAGTLVSVVLLPYEAMPSPSPSDMLLVIVLWRIVVTPSKVNNPPPAIDAVLPLIVLLTMEVVCVLVALPLKMPPPLLAEFPETVLSTSASLPKPFHTPPPKNAAFPEIATWRRARIASVRA